MAMSVLNSLEIEKFLKHLECPVCLVAMRPPIYIYCSTGHSICNGCYDSVEDCPLCKVSYGKIFGDTFEETRLIPFRCSQGCYLTLRNNDYSIYGNERVNQISCRGCRAKYDVIAFDGELVTEEKFNELKDDFHPTRNYSLEAMTEFVTYPCEAAQCTTKYKLAEQKDHQSACIYRAVQCPSPDCVWKGPFNSLTDHFAMEAMQHVLGAVDEHHTAQKGVKFDIPIADSHTHEEVVLLSGVYGFEDSTFIFALIRRPSEISFFLRHYGTVASSEDVNGRVTFFSRKDPTFKWAITFPIRNDLLVKDGNDLEPLPPIDFLRERHFIDRECMTVQVDVWRKAEPEITDLIDTVKAEPEINDLVDTVLQDLSDDEEDADDDLVDVFRVVRNKKKNKKNKKY